MQERITKPPNTSSRCQKDPDMTSQLVNMAPVYLILKRDVFRNHDKQTFSRIDIDEDASSTLDCSKHHQNNGG